MTVFDAVIETHYFKLKLVGNSAAFGLNIVLPNEIMSIFLVAKDFFFQLPIKKFRLLSLYASKDNLISKPITKHINQ